MTIRFACELAALAALAWTGALVGGTAAAIVAPVAAAILWAAWVAPKARTRLRDPARFVVESTVWIAATGGLVWQHEIALAIGFATIAFATAVGARRYEPEVSSSRRDA